MKRIAFTSLLVFLCALVAPGCAKKPTEPPPPTTGHTLSGTVRVGSVGLQGALVAAESGSTGIATTTTASGTYSFHDLPSGTYQVSVTAAGHSLSPVGRIAEVPGGGTTNLDFRGTPASTLFTLTGAITPAIGGVLLTFGGDGTGMVMTAANGSFAIRGLIVGDYTITPSHTGHHFSPPSRLLTGSVAFTHPETGNGTLGDVTIGSVTWNAQDASAFFEITSPPVDGVGSIRARRRTEIAAGSLAAIVYDAMWNAGGIVVVAIDTALGTYSIQIRLGPTPTITASSATFLVAPSLSPLVGNDFTAIGH